MQYVNPDVATICTGLAASMGAVLLCGGAANKRSALPHARVMIHQPMGGTQGQASDIEITAREILKLKKELYDIIAHHSGKTYQEGNRLVGVDDASPAAGPAGDFRDNSSTYAVSGTVKNTEYHYDANGNLKADADKGISFIGYN